LFIQSDGVFAEIPLYCDGTDETTIEAKECEMPLTVLTSSPFNLQAGNEIQAEFKAHNLNGWGPYSDPTPTQDAALIQSNPMQM
jgi:hypothetical protein